MDFEPSHDNSHNSQHTLFAKTVLNLSTSSLQRTPSSEEHHWSWKLPEQKTILALSSDNCSSIPFNSEAIQQWKASHITSNLIDRNYAIQRWSFDPYRKVRKKSITCGPALIPITASTNCEEENEGNAKWDPGRSWPANRNRREESASKRREREGGDLLRGDVGGAGHDADVEAGRIPVDDGAIAAVDGLHGLHLHRHLLFVPGHRRRGAASRRAAEEEEGRRARRPCGGDGFEYASYKSSARSLPLDVATVASK